MSVTAGRSQMSEGIYIILSQVLWSTSIDALRFERITGILTLHSNLLLPFVWQMFNDKSAILEARL